MMPRGRRSRTAAQTAVAAAVLMLAMTSGADAADSDREGATALLVPDALSLQSSPGMSRNGPVPAIVVDQFGYLPASRKIAVIRDPVVGYDSVARFTPGGRMALVDAASGAVMKTADVVLWNQGQVDPRSGDRAWWFDFSDVKRPGRYVVVDLDRGLRSADFKIAEDVYRDVLKHAVRMLFYQRAGSAKLPEHAGAAWADRASHLGPGQDAQSRPWPAAFPGSSPPVRDLRGGWYDAGDYNKYTTWTARNILVLLSAYSESPAAFGDDTEIPESGNGNPDLLDEVRWGLEWLVRMQAEDGSVLCVQALAGGSPPSAATGPSFYGPPTTAATLSTAAAFARASLIYRSLSDASSRSFGEDLAERARRAWQWAEQNPGILYYNNDEARQPGSKGLAHGQQELSERDRRLARFEAALYLHEATGDADLRVAAVADVDAMIPAYAPTLWEVDTHDALLRLAGTAAVAEQVSHRIRSWFLGHAGAEARTFAVDLDRTDPYRAPIPDYTWGSNKAKAMQGRVMMLVANYAEDQEVRTAARAAALDYVHYIHGVNPLGLVYLTNMGRAGAAHSANTMFHAWFAKRTRWESTGGGRPGPPPGFLVGGPNPSFGRDGCCTRDAGKPACWSSAANAICALNFHPPMGQPPAKSYLQFNDNWPANSWEVTEPSTGYQVYFIRLLSAFVGR